MTSKFVWRRQLRFKKPLCLLSFVDIVTIVFVSVNIVLDVVVDLVTINPILIILMIVFVKRTTKINFTVTWCTTKALQRRIK